MRGDAVNHAPYYRDTDGDTALLCIHGILGTPRHFDFLLLWVPENWTVHNILLAGHGGSMADFADATMEQWKQQVAQELETLSRRCSSVFILAHSMGCLFAVSAALHDPTVKGLFLLSPPMAPQISPVMARNGLRVAFHRVPQEDARATATLRACSIATTARLWQYLRWLPNYRALFREIRAARPRMRQVTVPVWAYISDRDELVSTRAARYIPTAAPWRVTHLPRSGHFYYTAEERQLLERDFAAFCREC